MGRKEDLLLLTGLFKMEYENYTLDEVRKLATKLKRLKVVELEKFYKELHRCKI